MPRSTGGFDFRRRRAFPGWGARVEWPPVNPVPIDPSVYTYISETTIIENEPTPPTGGGGSLGSPPDPFVIQSHSISGMYGVFNLDQTGGVQANAWPAANVAFFWPFTVHDAEGFPLVQVAWYNGVTVSGNVDFGIYDYSGNRKASLGGVAQSGTSQIQKASLSYTIPQGDWLCAISMDNTTGTVAWTGFFGMDRWTIYPGVRRATSAYPLPSTVTLATASSQALLVLSAMSRRTMT